MTPMPADERESAVTIVFGETSFKAEVLDIERCGEGPWPASAFTRASLAAAGEFSFTVDGDWWKTTPIGPPERETVTITVPDGAEYVFDTAPAYWTSAGPTWTAHFAEAILISHRVIWHRRLWWWIKAPWRWICDLRGVNVNSYDADDADGRGGDA
jgi:hypothetical protein